MLHFPGLSITQLFHFLHHIKLSNVPFLISLSSDFLQKLTLVRSMSALHAHIKIHSCFLFLFLITYKEKCGFGVLLVTWKHLPSFPESLGAELSPDRL
jgi:hypothetical protein